MSRITLKGSGSYGINSSNKISVFQPLKANMKIQLFWFGDHSLPWSIFYVQVLLCSFVWDERCFFDIGGIVDYFCLRFVLHKKKWRTYLLLYILFSPESVLLNQLPGIDKRNTIQTNYSGVWYHHYNLIKICCLLDHVFFLAIQ